MNSAPAFPSTEDGRREVEENSTGGTVVGEPVAATDFNNDTLSYSLSGTDAALFTIGTNDGQLRVATGANLDFESKRTLRVTVEVTGDAAVSVPENLNRVVATYRATDPERDTLTWSVSGRTFWISQQGQLYFRSPPDFEDGASYSVTVTAEDEDGLSGSTFVSVSVTDQEENGVVTITPRRGWFDTTGTQFSASLSDDDGAVTGTTWQRARSRNRSSWSDISGATSSSYTATADDVNHYLRATATYEDRRSSNKTAESVTRRPIGDTRPTTNNAPEFTETPPAIRSISQGTSAGRSIGDPVRAMAQDSDDVLTYSLSGTDAGLFSIDSDTGQLRTKAVLDYDPDGTNEYTVIVNVHDGFNSSYSPSTALDDTVEVTITVTRVAARQPSPPSPPSPPPPPLAFQEGTEASRTVPEDAQPGDEVGAPVLATSTQGLEITYSLTGTDSELFTVNEVTGQIHVADGSAFDYEGERKTYEVTMRAKTTSGNSSFEVSIAVSIVVSNVDRPGIAGDFDLDHDECISLPEVIKAYFNGDINLEEALGIITLYFELWGCDAEMQSGSEGGTS